MATYVMSDIHGEVEMLLAMLKKIDFKEEDRLFVLGDMVDRGPHPMQVVQTLMKLPNVLPFVGNHEMMALSCLPHLIDGVTNYVIEGLSDKVWSDLVLWKRNGADTTLREFHELSIQEREEVIEYFKDCLLYEELDVNGENYLLVHAGLGDFDFERPLYQYDIDDFVWHRTDYSTDYFPDRYVITGHTPTQMIKGNLKPGYIYKRGRQIGIDCGACFKGGRLATLCLETGEEFYVERDEVKRS